MWQDVWANPRIDVVVTVDKPMHPGMANLRPFKPGADHPRYKRGPSPKPRLSNGHTLTDLFRSYTEEAARLLHRVMKDSNEATETRIKAAALILARGWGDVPKTLLTSPLDGSARAIELSEDDLLRIASSVESGIRNAQQSVIDVEPEPDASP